MPNKTILYLITQSELGGAQRYIFDLANNFKNNYNVIVAFGEQGKAGELARQLKQSNIKYYTIPNLKRKISPWNDFKALLNLLKLIKKTRPNIIHLNSSKISILGSLAAFIYKYGKKLNTQCPPKKLNFLKRGLASFKINIIYTAHGWVFNEPLGQAKKIFYKYAEKITARFKDKIICVSEFDYKMALKEKIAPKDKLAIIHNGIKQLSFLPQKEARANLSKIIGQDLDKKFIIGSIGNFYPTKGFKFLLKAIKTLLPYYPEIILIIIGEGEQRKIIENFIIKNKMKNNVLLPGRINNAWKFLPAFDIYACSSLKEGLSYTIIEAMQAKLPIVATKIGGNPELIENNINGILVEPKNSRALADGIKKLIDSPDLRQKIAQETQTKVYKNYNLQKMIKMTKRYYS